MERILCDAHRIGAITSAVLKNIVRNKEEAIREEFIRMVDAILAQKESVERARQVEARANVAAGYPR